MLVDSGAAVLVQILQDRSAMSVFSSLKYEGYSEINLQWAVKKNKKEGKIFYFIQKLATYHDTSFCIPTSKKVAAKCKICAVIRFLQAEGHSAAEICRRISVVYGPNFMSDTYVREWCRKFRNGRTDIHDEGGQGRPCLVTDDLVQHVDKLVCKQCRFTISELSLEFPQVSQKVLYEIATKKRGYHKFCARWVLSSHAATFFDVGIQKFLSHYDKCLNLEDDYVEKWPTYVANFCI
ncbi:hypothetical protein Cfor_11189 [Coptotermes formosanus]|uniref:Mos1 transposase HTH domain-containing protein n=1 Tax=Coptotermes formosanus TaxID=36987 RepID=A0A6L2Q1J8_COPFO|nr:hypothetical protein Cfor_11189 [Coptotermes formosanus]